MTKMQADAIRILRSYRIIYGTKTEYENGQPVREVWLPVRYEKRGNFHYLGGKRVSRGCASVVFSAGMAA